MIEAVTAVARADAVAMAVASSANARLTLDGRQKRMRWLDALRAANGEAPAYDTEERDEAVREDNRRRIRAALDTINELRGLDAQDESDGGDDASPVSAVAIARLMLIRRHASLQAQAHLGAVSVCQLLG